MTVSSRLRAMQEALAGSANNGEERSTHRYYSFSKVKDDQSVTIRFLPDQNVDNPMGFLKELKNHPLKINGQTKRVPCLEMYGKSCPICEQARQFFASNQNALGSAFWHKKDYVAQAIVIDDPLKEEVNPTNPIRLFSLGKQILAVIKEAIKSGEIEADPDAFKGGYNFIIKKTRGGAKADGSGYYPAYNVGTRFSSKQTDLPDELIDLIKPNLINLDTLMPAEPDINSVHADLQAALVSAGVASAAPSNPRESAPWVAQGTPSTPSTPSVPVSSDDDQDKPALQSSAAALLARLKRG